MASSAKRAEARKKAEAAQKERKKARLGVESIPDKPKHVSKKKKGKGK